VSLVAPRPYVGWPSAHRLVVVRGDVRRAFADALIAQLPALRRFAIALAGNSAMADDLVQDCIERALRRSDQLSEPTRIAAWLRSILHNLYIDELRKKRTRGYDKDIGDLANDLALSAPAADRAETTDFVRAMATLSPEHRQILLLVGLEGMNYREAASHLNIPIGTVMSRLTRARDRLRAELERTEAPGARPGDAREVKQ
jgi:RNA polymerase sigma-70 factor (ECF subfamily)